MASGLWTWRHGASERNVEPAFRATVSLLFAVSTTVTIVWNSGMSAMSEMPMPGGWTMSMVWMRMPDQTWTSTVASWLSMWMVMMAAMMLPSLAPNLCRYRAAVTAEAGTELGRLTATVGVGYFSVWALVGLVVFALGSAVAVAVMAFEALSRAVPMASAAVVLVAGASQFSRQKAHHLECCRQLFEPRVTVPGDVGIAWRHGLRLGLHCSGSSAGPTAILLVMGVMDLRVMAVVTAAITAERLAPQGQTLARVIGFIGMSAGVTLMARAAGLA